MEQTVQPAPRESDVTVGADGWLFLTGGTNSAADQYLPTQENQASTEAWCDLIQARVGALSAAHTQYHHLVAPEKLSVYGDKAGLKHRGNSPLRRLAAALRKRNLEGSLIDLLPAFEDEKERALLYWKTDTHWTPQGCFLAYSHVCERMGLTPRPDLLERPFTEGELVLDLGGKLVPPVKEKARFYGFVRDAVRVDANVVVQFKERNNLSGGGLHAGSRVVYRNDSCRSNVRMVVFGDSFAECRPSLLTGMLAETVSELHFLWTSSIDFDYLRDVRPDVVMTEVAERFMRSVPKDGVPFEENARSKLADAAKRLGLPL